MRFKPNLFMYIVAGFLFFLFWLYWVFPYEALESRILTEIENRSKGRYALDFKDMDVSLFGNLEFKDLKISEWVGEEKKLLLKTPKFEIDLSPFALISKKIDGSFYVKGKKGEIEGTVAQDPDALDLEVNFDKYSLQDLSFLSAKLGTTLRGSLDGTLKMGLHKTETNRNSGKVDLKLNNLAMAEYEISLDPTNPEGIIKLPPLKITGKKGSHIKGQLQKQEINFTSIRLAGGDIDLNLTGKVTLRGKSPQDYRLNLKGGLKLSEALVKAIPFLAILDQQKNAEGVYPLTISGRLGKPAIRVGKFKIPL